MRAFKRDALRDELRGVRHALVSAPAVVRSAPLEDPFNIHGDTLTPPSQQLTASTCAALSDSSPIRCESDATPAAKRFRMESHSAFERMTTPTRAEKGAECVGPSQPLSVTPLGRRGERVHTPDLRGLALSDGSQEVPAALVYQAAASPALPCDFSVPTSIDFSSEASDE